MGFEFQFHDSDIEEDVMQVERPEEKEEKETARDSQDPTIVKPFHTEKLAHVASQLYPALVLLLAIIQYLYLLLEMARDIGQV